MSTGEPEAEMVSDRCGKCGAPLESARGVEGVCASCCLELMAALEADIAAERRATTVQGARDGYAVGELLGKGGMGAVYLARRVSDGAAVAVKYIHRHIAGDDRLRARFLREARALGALDHPHIVKLLDSGEDGDGPDRIPFLVIEYVPGTDLRHELRDAARKGERLPLHRAVETGLALGRALAAAHAQGVLHRDIKPANILTAPDGTVKLADFGMVDCGPPGLAALTVSRLAGGAHFTAPELEAEGRGGATADLYSVGAVLFNMLAGQPPRFGRTRPSQGRMPDSPQEQMLWRKLDRVVLRALAPQPGDRYGKAEELLADLEQVRRLMVPAEAARWLRQRGRRTLAWIAAAAVVVAGAAWGWRWYGESKARQTEQARAEALRVRLKPVPPGWQPEKWENSLGMPFVSIPDCGVMFCQWETRVQDYTAFSQNKASKPWRQESGFAFAIERATASLRHGEFKEYGDDWREPGFVTAPDHAVCGVSAFDAQAFCTWLTWNERHSGKITAEQAYRLPTDEEWSAAAGLAPEPGQTPEQRAASWPAEVFAWSWGTAWPAPNDAVNVAGDEVLGPDWNPRWVFKSRHDPWPRAAPVNAGPPSALGLYHLTGNVEEFTESDFKGGNTGTTIRGGSWFAASREGQSLHYRISDFPIWRNATRGFRMVFQKSGAPGWRYGGERR